LKKRVKTSIGNLPSPPRLTNEEEEELLPPEDFLVPGIASYKPRAAPKRPLDPVLTDDIERVEMYEESWLSAQESSVAQLLNHLLAEYSPTPAGKNRLALRKEFLAMYAAAPFPITFNRVHASLLYGALSITQHVLDKSSVARISRPTNANGEHIGWGADVGARQKFMDLFMGSYEQSALITALEVIVGREMFAYARPGESERKVMESFIERYIINSEDLLSSNPEPAQKNKRGTKVGGHTGEDEDRGTPAWLLRRSLLRSFMLILLLDKAKSRGLLGRQCLFIEVRTPLYWFEFTLIKIDLSS
jgi:abnormal spindle-like microcephaly-associated protein